MQNTVEKLIPVETDAAQTSAQPDLAQSNPVPLGSLGMAAAGLGEGAPHEQTSSPIITGRVFVRDLLLPARIGVFPQELDREQMIRLSLDLEVTPDALPDNDDQTAVVRYDQIVAQAKSVIAEGHIGLVETLAHRLADICLEDPRVLSATVTVEKLQAVPQSASVGVTMTRRRNSRQM
ncbi:MAG: dihydroneopterin aldolase [Pseudomonadota bacterium]